MFFAHRTRQRIKFALAGVAAYGALVFLLTLFAGNPNEPLASAYVRWLFGIPALLLALAALEFSTTWALDRPFWNRMPSWLRVGLLVLVIAGIALAAIWLNTNLASASAA